MSSMTTLPSNSEKEAAPLVLQKTPRAARARSESFNKYQTSVPTSVRRKTLIKVAIAVFLLLAAIATTIYFLLSAPKKFAYLNDQCGSGNGISVAPISVGNSNTTGLCCSPSGYAGYTLDHCGVGCQASYGRCDDLKSTTANDTLLLSRLVSYNCKNPKDFALTFDDGPSEFTASLLDYLKSAGVKATFFMNGNSWKQNYSIPFSKNQSVQRSRIFERADVVKRAFQEGHQICSHTWSHVSISKKNPYNLTYEISRLNYHFEQILGKIPTCFRPPYGTDVWLDLDLARFQI